MKSRLLIALTGAILSSGCDSTGPDDPFELRLTSTVSAPSTTLQPDSTLRIACDVTLRARATGSGDDAAVWEDGELRWFVGMDRTQPIAVDALSQEDVRAFWESDRLLAAGLLTGGWELWAGVPFTTEAEFRYRVNGSGPQRSADIALHCGLDADSTLVAPPVVTNVTVQGPTPLEPGDTLTVSYAASGAGRLYATAIVVEGAWQHIRRVPENLVGQTQRAEKFVIPPGVILGMPLDIGVAALDAFGQESAPVWVQSAPLADVTPPYYLRATTAGAVINGPQRLVGQYATVDTIAIGFHAYDNHELGELIVDLGTEQRRFPLDGNLLESVVTIPVEPAWAGAGRLAVSVTDSEGLMAPTIESHPDSFRIFPALDRPQVSWTGLDRYRNAVWDDANERLYLIYREPLVVGGTDRQLEVVVLSTATMMTLPGYPLPAPGVALDYTVGGDTVVVSLGDRGTLAIVDVGSRIVSEIRLSPGTWRHAGNLTVLGNGRALVELVESGGPPYLALVDIADGTVLWTRLLDRSGVVFARTRDRSAVGIRAGLHGALTCLMVYTSATEHLSGCLSGGGSHGALSADATGSRFLSAEYLVDVASGSFRLATWGMREDRVPVSVFAPDDTTMYRSDAGGLTHIRVSDGVAIARSPFPILGQLLVSADGSSLVAAGNDFNNTSRPVTVVRLQLR